METKGLSKVHPPLPPNSVIPERVESEYLKLGEEGKEIEEGYGSEGGLAIQEGSESEIS